MPLIEKMDCELWHFICGTLSFVAKKNHLPIFMHENKTGTENRPNSRPLVAFLKAIRSKWDVGTGPPKKCLTLRQH